MICVEMSSVEMFSEKLEEVDRQVEELEQLIATVKKLTPLEKDCDDSSDEEEDDKKGGTVNCISCGKVRISS